MQRTRVLYVDDEEIMLSSFKLLAGDEYEVLVATSGEEALGIFKQEPDIAIVVADQVMSGMTGVELLEKIIEINPDTIRIILTGYWDMGTVIAAINRGHVYSYLLKPLTKDEISLALKRARETHDLVKENRDLASSLAEKNRALEAVNIRLREVNSRLCEDIVARVKAEKQVRHLSWRVIQVAEEERKRVARDLHDEFGQVLPALLYSVEEIRDSLPAGCAEQRQILTKATGLIRRMGDTCRQIAFNLRPDILDHLGLIPTLRSCVDEFSELHRNIRIDFRVNGVQKIISSSAEIILYRVFQEALNNIVKHAGASRVSVVLTGSYPDVILTVTDNGSGFDENQWEDTDTKNRGVGLIGMRERVASLGGTLVIRSQREKGTRIKASLPMAPRADPPSGLQARVTIKNFDQGIETHSE